MEQVAKSLSSKLFSHTRNVHHAIYAVGFCECSFMLSSLQSVGALLGVRDGVSNACDGVEGTTVGSKPGVGRGTRVRMLDNVGKCVRATRVGFRVGLEEGLCEGDNVGNDVGKLVVGVRVGLSLGGEVGSDDCTIVGEFVGTAVGSRVGK